ncbi:MAG: hypothetical protein QOJ27_2169 [Sphingomonadales bacterium]|nr:hypothetical protein [Sphingomonadales bacterium]
MAEESGEAAAPAAQRVMMIGGAMRSGTTVIHRALCTAGNSNPFISESWFLRDLLAMYRFRLARFEAMGEDQFGPAAAYGRMLAEDVEDYVRAVSARHGGPEILILKHPELIRNFADLAGLAPAMLFLAVVRDPRDVVASMKRVRDSHARDGIPGPLAGARTIAGLCDYYGSHYGPLLDAAPALGARLKMVRYEDFMRSPADAVAEIGAYCGARYEMQKVADFRPDHAASATFDKKARADDPFSRAFWSDLYTKPLSGERIGRFAESLSPPEIREIEARLAFVGRRFGYWGERA